MHTTQTTRCQFAAYGSLVMARCDGGGEGRPARRARGGSAPARSWWRGAACGGGEGEGRRLVALELGRIRRGEAAPGTADVGEGPRRGDRVGRRLVAAWRQFVTTATEDGGVVPDLDGEMENQQLGEMTTLKSTKSTKAGNQDR